MVNVLELTFIPISLGVCQPDGSRERAIAISQSRCPLFDILRTDSTNRYSGGRFATHVSQLKVVTGLCRGTNAATNGQPMSVASPPPPADNRPMTKSWFDIHDAKRDVLKQWTERLYVEYDNILYHFRLKLRPPVIRIEELAGSWGLWSPQTRCLTISRRLIELYPWDVVIEVLKHEMAHQVVNEVYGVVELHGPHFKRACAKLGVAPWAAAASGELPHEIPSWKEKRLTEDEERLLKRVEKLLSLASSANEHEAALAMQRVRQLYAKYNIDRIEGRRDASNVYCMISHKKRRIESTDSMIFSILTEHFFVKAIYTNLYDATDLCEYKAVELLGTRENVLMAEYVYFFLRNQLRALWKDFKRRTGKEGARAKRSYSLGVLTGFRDKLAAEPSIAREDTETRPASVSQALLKVGDRELEEFVGFRHPRLTSRRWGTGSGDRSSYDAGVADGGKVTIHKGITKSDGNRGLRLTSG